MCFSSANKKWGNTSSLANQIILSSNTGASSTNSKNNITFILFGVIQSLISETVSDQLNVQFDHKLLEKVSFISSVTLKKCMSSLFFIQLSSDKAFPLLCLADFFLLIAKAGFWLYPLYFLDIWYLMA